MKKSIILCLFLVFVLNLNAQNFKIKGKVIDAKSEVVVPYATVLISKASSPDSVKYSGLTDENGKFSIEIDSLGDYLLRTNMFGFDVYEEKISLPKATDSIDVGLIKLYAKSEKIDEIVISKQKQIIKTEAGKISYNVDADPEAQASNVLELMRKVPMISVDGEDNIKLRGSGNYKIYMNGKPTPLFSNNPQDILRSLPANQVKKIEVITSPGAKYDAEGVGGIINIVMNEEKKISGIAGSVSAGVTTLRRYSSSVSLKAAVNKFVISTNLWGYTSLDQNSFGSGKRENYLDENFKFTESNYNGKNTNKSLGGYGSMSYEIDSLNLITGSFYFYSGVYSGLNTSNKLIKNNNGDIMQQYETQQDIRSPHGNGNFSLDYQNISKKNKAQILTISYRLDASPQIGDQKNAQIINPIVNFIRSNKIREEEKNSAEHTGQIDYQIPIKKLFTIETGLKYIMRLHKNKLDAQYLDYSRNEFLPDSARLMDFLYNHQIGAAYLQLRGNIKKINYKVGLRCEKSFLDAKYKIGGINFDNSNLEFVPSVSISYQISNFHGLSFSYNKRISRPDFYYLNPAVNDLDPKYISYGNPKLLPEHFHSFDLNWNWTMNKGNVNSSIFYSYGKDEITDIMELRANDVVHSTYGNYGNTYTAGISENINIYPTSKLMFFVNGGVYYTDVKNNKNTKMQSQSISGFFYGQARYTIGKGFNLSSYFGGSAPSKDLQSKHSGYYYYGISINKKLFKDKLQISVGARNFLKKNRKFTSTTNDINFISEAISYSPQRAFSFTIRYRFGELKASVKRTQKTISNDDLKGGDPQGGGGDK